jgi:hypothetical protein
VQPESWTVIETPIGRVGVLFGEEASIRKWADLASQERNC